VGFDVTFHPVRADELRRYLFDVIADGSLAEHRAGELATAAKHRNLLLKLYGSFPEWLAEPAPVPNTFAFAAAIVAGFLHPYWYARGTAFTLLAEGHVPEMAGLFVPLGQMAPGRLSSVPDRSRGLFRGNESASGFVPPERIARAQELLESLADRPGRGPLSMLETLVDEESLESLRAVTRYCREHGLGLVEATDLVVPFSGECVSNYDNLRAPFLNRMEP
jgi:hypothetical protein